MMLTRLLPALVLAPCLGACLAVPDGPAPECQVTTDCDTDHGEVCEEGVCYGNPPAGMFVAVVSPPSELKTKLVSRELGEVPIDPDGQLGEIAFEQPATYAGQLRLLCPAPLDCSATAYAATITVTRPALFSGGPGFRAVIETEPQTGKFQFIVPRDRDNVPFTITVVPEGRAADGDNGGVLTAQMVPPMHTTLLIASDRTGQTLDVGAASLPTIDGTIMNSVGVGLGSYRVVALGRWELDAPLTEVSTVAYTGNDGKFALRLSKELVGPVEIVAKPYGSSLLPTLRFVNVPSAGGVVRNLVAPASLGGPHDFAIQVRGGASGGEISPISGARVSVVGLTSANSVLATITAEATTGDDGLATVTLLDGAAFATSYRISIVPPASATVGMLFDDPLDLAGDLKRRLPDRMPIRGIVRDVAGAPLKDVQVTVHPSLRFEWSLDPIPQAFLSTIPAATAVTLETGEFVVFVDPFLADIWGTYDLAFEPTAVANAPSWSQNEVEIPRDLMQTTVDLADIVLPDAAHVHGRIADPSGSTVEGAELKLFQVNTSLAALCTEVSHAPSSCPIPANLMGRGTSDDAGTVRLTLPRP